jgi:hypothetical protein
MLESAQAVLNELLLIAERLRSEGGPGDLNELARLVKSLKSRISPHRSQLKKFSRHSLDFRIVESVHADLVDQAESICTCPMFPTGDGTAAKRAGALLRDYVAKARPELAFEAALIGDRKIGGRPRSIAKAKAVRCYQESRSRGDSCKAATEAANREAGTGYKTATLKRYAKQNG